MSEKGRIGESKLEVNIDSCRNSMDESLGRLWVSESKFGGNIRVNFLHLTCGYGALGGSLWVRLESK